MRYITKSTGSEAAECIRGFVETQNVGRASGIAWQELPLDYAHFTRTPQLRALLIQEQKDLCAYTGVGLDRPRLVRRTPSRGDHSFKPCIEHLKPQSQCRSELQARGGVVGRDLGEDLDHANMVAAVEVVGTASEHFGASYRGDRPLPMVPTNPACVSAFVYADTGHIFATDNDSQETIRNLNLDHETPKGWRSGAIQAWIPMGQQTPQTELEVVIDLLEDENRTTMPEFAFVVAQVARAYLAMQQSRA